MQWISNKRAGKENLTSYLINGVNHMVVAHTATKIEAVKHGPLKYVLLNGHR